MRLKGKRFEIPSIFSDSVEFYKFDPGRVRQNARGDRVAFHQATYSVFHSLDTRIQAVVKSARV